jgi:hypothetical protein
VAGVETGSRGRALRADDDHAESADVRLGARRRARERVPDGRGSRARPRDGRDAARAFLEKPVRRSDEALAT